MSSPDSTHTGDPEPRCGECGEPRVKELPGATWWYADAPYGRDAGRRDWRPGAG